MKSQKVSQEVIINAKAGCRKAENKIYTAYCKLVGGYIKKNAYKRADLDLLHADIFIKIFKHLPKFDENTPDAFVYTITKSMVRDYNRKLPEIVMFGDYEIESDNNGGLNEMVEKENIIELEILLESFKKTTSETHYSALEKLIEGYSYLEIFEEDKYRTKSIGTIKSRINTVRKQFREFLNEQK